MAGGFEEFFEAATGGAPDAGQAANAVLPWLFRRLVDAPESTPRRLIYVLPANSLPEQVFARIRGWLDRLGRQEEVGTYLLAGAVRDGGWLRHPERTAILVGTHDLLLSRALMRGFADSRRIAPVAYALLHNDAQWVFDGSDRYGPGLPTSIRLQEMRDELGTFAPTASLWMSATQGSAIGRPLPAGDIGDLAQAVVAAHVDGTETVVVLGSLTRARALHGALCEAAPEHDTLLIHPYFRAADRRERLALLGEPDRDRIVIGTQALEVGIDLAPHTLLAELGLEDSGGAPGRMWDQSDLLALFDTAVDPPDLDVARWICEPADRTALIAWRAWESGEPSEQEPDPGRDELCPVPLDELRRVLDGRAWLRDRLDGLWRRATAGDLEPGVHMLLDARYGGYLSDQGWAPESTIPVSTMPPGPDLRMFACVDWVSLDQHLAETEEEARTLIDALPHLPAAQQEAVILAARYHDLGKCHEVFQELLRAGGGDPPDVLLAKSKAPYNTGRARRPGFRHELVSALMLAHGDHWHGDGSDHRLVTYLAAAHHGQVRISVRTEAESETETDEATVAPSVLGVLDGDRTPPVTLSSGETFPAQFLHTAGLRPETGGSWTVQARALRDREDLGPFRLAYLEALVRIADWRSSGRHDGPVEAG